MQTTHITPNDDLQARFDALRGGQRLVLRGEFSGAYSVPESAEGSEIVFDEAVIDGHDEWPKGPLDMHNGGLGYAEGALFVQRASKCRVWGHGVIRNSRGSGWRLNAAQGSEISGLDVDNCRWQLFRVDGKENTIRNIVASNGGMFNPTDRSAKVSNWPNGGTIKDGINCLAENIRVMHTYGEGLGNTGAGNTLRNIQIHNCMSAALYLNNSGPVDIDGLLMTHDGLTHLRGGGPAGGLTFGAEDADKQEHRPGTYGATIRRAVAIGCGPGLAFRSQRAGATFTDILIEQSTFYESREAKGKVPVAVWLTPDATYNNIMIRHSLFEQTVGKRSNLKQTPVDLNSNAWAMVASMAPPRLPYTGDLRDYIGAAGAQWWETGIKAERWETDGGGGVEPVDPMIDQAELRAWLKEAADLPAQIEAWLARGRALVG